MLRDSDLTLYALGLGVRHADAAEPGRESGGELLNVMSLDTGGRYFEVETPYELPVVMRQLDLRSQYLLGFWPSPASLNGNYPRLQLRLVGVAGKSKVRVYWRPGYFAPEAAVAVSGLRAAGVPAPAQSSLPAPTRRNVRF
jgi:hypothetical protein